MRFLADEGVDAAIVSAIRSDGHDVRWMAEESEGSTDDMVLDAAAAAGLRTAGRGGPSGSIAAVYEPAGKLWSGVELSRPVSVDGGRERLCIHLASPARGMSP
jgi:hypothetical protein